jgi:hypothetical protein
VFPLGNDIAGLAVALARLTISSRLVGGVSALVIDGGMTTESGAAAAGSGGLVLGSQT